MGLGAGARVRVGVRAGALTQPYSATATAHAARNAVGSHATTRPVRTAGTQQARPIANTADAMHRNGARMSVQPTRVASVTPLMVRRCV